jgi:hypothetical protein
MAERTLLQRLHNPRNRGCGCDSDCWCNRTALGRAVKWWFPARWFGIEHKHTRIQNMAPAEREEWKRQQDTAGGAEQMSAREEQPSYESMIRLRPMAIRDDRAQSERQHRHPRARSSGPPL